MNYCWCFSASNICTIFWTWLKVNPVFVQPLCVSRQQTPVSRSAFLHRPPLHEHHLGALRPLRHLPDSGHQRLSGGLQHLPHPLRWWKRRLLHQGECVVWRVWLTVQVTSASADKKWGLFESTDCKKQICHSVHFINSYKVHLGKLI